MHKYECEICNKEFFRDWKDPKRETPKYCSRNCYSKGREKKHLGLIGHKNGKLMIKEISKERSKRGHISLRCLCECGNEKNVPFHHLKNVVSCGCWKSGKARKLPTFLKKIEKTENCWIWQGMISKSGYGRQNSEYAHRLSYQYHKGEIPKDKMICHTCNNKKCVNPDHMYLGTAKDNALDAIRDGVYIKRSLTSKRWKS